jgi:foldase protein PrsA
MSNFVNPACKAAAAARQGRPSRFRVRSLLVVCGLLTLGSSTLLVGQALEPSNQILMRVNDHIATQYDFQKQLANRRRAINTQAGLSEERRNELLEKLDETVLSDLFEELLVRSRAAQLGIVVTDFELDQVIAEMRKANNLENDAQLEQALTAEGLTLADLRERYRIEDTRRSLAGREVRPRVDIKDEQLRQLYDDNPDDFKVPAQVKVSEVVVLEGTGAEALADQVAKDLANGMTFGGVKEKHGALVSDPIEVGWVSRGDLDPVLEAAAWDLEVGSYSAPVEARGGYHVVQVIERREAALRPFEEAKEILFRREFGRRMAEEYQEYLDELASTAYRKCAPQASEFCKERAAKLGGDRLDVDRLFKDLRESEAAADDAPEDATESDDTSGR